MPPRKKAKYSRVYQKHGAWFWVEPRTNKWVKLCPIADDESTMLERLAVEKKQRERPSGSGDMRALVDQYVRDKKAAHKEKAWPSYGKYAGNGFRDMNVADVKPSHVNTWIKTKYADKLPMQRVMRAFLSGFFQWGIDNGRRETNPCRDVKIKKPRPSKTYITDEHFAAIRAAMLETTYKRNGVLTVAKVPTGPMMQCIVDLCYLTAQRSTEIRFLKWSDIDRAAGVIHFVPTKTEDSSGIAVDFKITPEIEAVLARIREIDGHTRIGDTPVVHTKEGTVYAANTILKAWKVAKARAELAHMKYTIKDIRAKALTDGQRDGYDIAALQIAAAHTDEKMTEDYIKLRNVPVADVRLRIPGRAA